MIAMKGDGERGPCARAVPWQNEWCNDNERSRIQVVYTKFSCETARTV